MRTILIRNNTSNFLAGIVFFRLDDVTIAHWRYTQETHEKLGIAITDFLDIGRVYKRAVIIADSLPKGITQ